MRYHNYHGKVAVDIGMMVHQARVAKGLSQSELAKRCRTKQEAIARLENGNTLPTIRTLLRIAEGLETTLVPPSFAFITDVIAYRKRFRYVKSGNTRTDKVGKNPGL